MKINECVCIGFIASAKGYEGKIKVILKNDFRNSITNKQFVFVEINKKPVPFFIEEILPDGHNSLTVKLEDINSVTQANELNSFSLYLPANKVRKKKSDKHEYKIFIGYDVYCTSAGSLGKITDIIIMPQQYMAKIFYKNKEILIPLNENIIKKVDDKNKIISLELPSGLLELYLA